MAYARGRTIASAGNLFGEYTVDSGATPAAGQPFMVRMQGIPTAPGYRDRPGKWNVIFLPLNLALTATMLRAWLEKWWS